jgi:hypothetical protein
MNKINNINIDKHLFNYFKIFIVDFVQLPNRLLVQLIIELVVQLLIELVVKQLVINLKLVVQPKPKFVIIEIIQYFIVFLLAFLLKY